MPLLSAVLTASICMKNNLFFLFKNAEVSLERIYECHDHLWYPVMWDGHQLF